jgi:serine phosphatase RsbU (regulator of sigma subunit)
MPQSAPHPAAVTMQCMEVWGGNQATLNSVVMPGLDAWVLSRPYEGDHAGGDIHYVSSCATGRITRLLIADVSGHGSGASSISSTLRSLMRRFVNVVDQRRLMQQLNAAFSDTSEAGGFATAVVATYSMAENSLVISNAGHPRPLVHRAREGRWDRLDFKSSQGLTNIPLGIAAPTSYDEAKFPLRDGDLVMFYTDALAEAKDAAGRMLGEEGLIEILNSLDPTHPESIAGACVDRVRAVSGGGHLNDDVTVLVVRPNAMRQRRVIPAVLGAIARGVRKRLAPDRASTSR